MNNPQQIVHDLKTWTEHYQNVIRGLKPWEIRLNDRDYKVGDILNLKEYFPNLNEFSGESTLFEVTHILHGGQFGIEKGFCIMSIKPFENE